MKLIRVNNPFTPSKDKTEIEFTTREEMLAYIAEHKLASEQYALSLNGEILPPEKLNGLAIPEVSSLVVMPVLGNKTLQSIALIGVAVAALVFAPALGAALFPNLTTATATALGGAIIAIGGTLLVNGIASLFQKNQGGASYTFDGPQTVARSGLPIPKGYGVFMSAPNIIQSWVDLQHADQDLHDVDDGAADIGRQWLNIIACFGFGPAVSLSDIRINGNDIASYTDVAYFIKLGVNDQQPVDASDAGWTILNQTTTGSAPNTAPTTDFNRIVNNYPQSQRIRCDIPKNYVTVTGTRNDTERLDVIVQFPRGVWRYDDNMVIKRLDIRYKVYYKLTTDSAWTLAQDHYYTNIRQSILRQITTIDGLPAGQYDVKVEKIGSGAHGDTIYSVEHESDYFGDEIWLESVQETCYDALAYPNMILLGLRIMASDQIAGANIQITALVTYDTRVSLPAELSGYDHSNPALVAYDVLTDPLVGGGLAPANINLPAFVEWAELCETPIAASATIVAAPALPYAPPAGQSAAWSFPTAYVNPDPPFSVGPTIYSGGLPVVGTIGRGSIYGGISFNLSAGESLGPNTLSGRWSAFIPPLDMPVGAIIRDIRQVEISTGMTTHGYISGTGFDSVYEAKLLNTVPGAPGNSGTVTWIGLAVYYDDPANITPTTATVPAGVTKLGIFNGIFEEANKTVWDSFASIGVMSRATPTRIGTQVGVMLDEPDNPVQVFNVGNILKDSYSKDYLAIDDRANEVEVDYANADDDYKTRNPVRCIPAEDQDAGYAIKKTRVNLLGCTSTALAYNWGMHKLLENQLLLRTHKWDSPAQAIVCRVGNVVLLQHDVPQWANGGRVIGGTASAPMVDAAYTYSSGQTFTVVFPALKRTTGTISAISGKVVTVSGYSGAAVKRLVKGTIDTRITAYSSSTVTVDDTTGLSNGDSVDLYDTDVIVTESVTGISSSGQESTLTLASALPAAPVADSPYILAATTSQPKLVRIRGIKRSGDQKFSITAIDYDPAVYDIPLPSGDDLLALTSGGSGGLTASTADPTTTPPAAPPTDVLSPTDPGYGGSSVPSGKSSYTLSPVTPLSQTTATNIALAAVTATYVGGTTASIASHNFTISDPGAGNAVWYYVFYDGTTYYCETGTTKLGDPTYTYLGSILATHTAGVHSAAMPGGWPIPSNAEAAS